MTRTKTIFQIYLENFFPEDIRKLFILWVRPRMNDPEIEEALEELWDRIRVPADDSTHRELDAVKKKLKTVPQTAAVNRRAGSIRTAIQISAAACLAALVVSLYVFLNPGTPGIDREDAFALFDAADIDSMHATTIIAGSTIATTGDNDLIRQTESGDLIVSGNTEVDLSAAGAGTVQVLVPKGKRSQMQFSDGTMVWLNSGTQLIYPKRFGDKRRDIFIDGEIYIEVAKDSGRPFFVNTKNMNVKVLGTTFNIRSYTGEAEQSVVLIEGKVEVQTPGRKMKERLAPDQAVFYNGREMVKKDVDVEDYIGWRCGVLKLGGESLRTIFDRLSKHYNIDIIYEGDSGGERYKGKLLLGGSVEEVLNAIAIKVEFTFDNDGNTIRIHKKQKSVTIR